MLNTVQAVRHSAVNINNACTASRRDATCEYIIRSQRNSNAKIRTFSLPPKFFLLKNTLTPKFFLLKYTLTPKFEAGFLTTDRTSGILPRHQEVHFL